MILLTVLFSVIGIALSAGGIWLLALGGSPYYLIAGLMFIVVGVTLKFGDRVRLLDSYDSTGEVFHLALRLCG